MTRERECVCVCVCVFVAGTLQSEETESDSVTRAKEGKKCPRKKNLVPAAPGTIEQMIPKLRNFCFRLVRKYFRIPVAQEPWGVLLLWFLLTIRIRIRSCRLSPHHHHGDGEVGSCFHLQQGDRWEPGGAGPDRELARTWSWPGSGPGAACWVPWGFNDGGEQPAAVALALLGWCFTLDRR